MRKINDKNKETFTRQNSEQFLNYQQTRERNGELGD